MEDLDLYGVKVTDAGMEHLRKLKKLGSLNLLGAQITDASAGILSGLRNCGSSTYIVAASRMQVWLSCIAAQP